MPANPYFRIVSLCAALWLGASLPSGAAHADDATAVAPEGKAPGGAGEVPLGPKPPQPAPPPAPDPEPEPTPDPLIGLDWSTQQPSPGEQVWLRLWVRNDSAVPIRVPADCLDGVQVVVDHIATGDRRGFAGRGLLYMPRDPIPATQLQWVTLAPEAVLERFVQFGDVQDACKGGCPIGRYHIQLWRAPRRLADAESDQFEPYFDAVDQTFAIEPHTIAVESESAVSARLVRVRWRRPGELVGEVEFTNQSSVPYWLWRPDAGFSTCWLGWQLGQEAEELQSHMAAGGQSSWNERDGVTLAPGQRVRLPVSCEASLAEVPKQAKQVQVRFWLSPRSDFVPRRAVAVVHHLSRTVLTSKLPLPRK